MWVALPALVCIATGMAVVYGVLAIAEDSAPDF